MGTRCFSPHRGTQRLLSGHGTALVIFAVQVAFSHWWLARFRFGPAEWLWRSLTYRKAQPMRQPTATVEARATTV